MDPVLSLTICLILSGFWMYSALHKLSRLDWFRSVLREYNLFSEALIRPLSVLVPITELLIALGLLFIRPAGAAASALLFAVYATLLVFTKFRGITLKDCGCNWGRHSESNRFQSSVSLNPLRNVIFIALSLVLLVPSTYRDLTFLDWGNSAAAAIACGLFALVANELTRNFSNMKASGYV